MMPSDITCWSCPAITKMIDPDDGFDIVRFALEEERKDQVDKTSSTGGWGDVASTSLSLARDLG